MFVDLVRRAQHIPRHCDSPHLGSDIGNVVVALQKSWPVELLIRLAPHEFCETSFGLWIAIVGNRNGPSCDRCGCCFGGDSVLGSFVEMTICYGDAGDQVEAKLEARLVSQNADPDNDLPLNCRREGRSGGAISRRFACHDYFRDNLRYDTKDGMIVDNDAILRDCLLMCVLPQKTFLEAKTPTSPRTRAVRSILPSAFLQVRWSASAEELFLGPRALPSRGSYYQLPP